MKDEKGIKIFMSKRKFGIILLNDNTVNCLNTLVKMLDTVQSHRNDVQISLVWCMEEETSHVEHNKQENILKPEELVADTIEELDSEIVTDQVLREYACYKKIPVYGREHGIFNERLKKAYFDIDSEYIHMTVPNVYYSDEFWAEVFAFMEDKRPKAFMVKVGMKNPVSVVKEHNGNINKMLEIKNISDSEYEEGAQFYPYHLIHSIFYSYFVRKEYIDLEKIDSTSNKLHWVLKVICMYTCSLSMLENIEPMLSVLSKRGYSGTYSWKELSDKEKALVYINEFLEVIYSLSKEHPENKNLKYNILYFVKMLVQNCSSSEDGIVEFQKKTEEILSSIKEEELILENQYFDRILKKCILERVKWVEDSENRFKEKKEEIFNDGFLENTVVFLKMERERVEIEGRCTMYGEEPFEIYIRINGEDKKCKIIKKENFRQWFYINITHTQYYSCEVPLTKGQVNSIQIVCKKKDYISPKVKMNFSMYAPLTSNLPLFERKHGWLMFYERESGKIIISPDYFSTRVHLKIKREKGFLTGGKIARKALLARGVYHLIKLFKKKEIWLISDRINRGDDNGECFFRYLSEHPQKDVSAYFVVDKHCPAYKQMKKYGKVISVYSWKHKMYHLLSDYVISSQANKPVINPFGKIFYHYSDLLYNKRNIFLQHGVTKDDQSAWLNRFNRNLYGFVVATKAEYNSIFDADYFYEPKNVWLTGMPRYDRLYNDEKKYITIMPTWRKALSAGTTAAGEWKVSSEFGESDYFKFYNGLLNHKRLIEEAEKRGYTLCFMPHPNITQALPLFDRDERVQFWDASKSYRDVFAQADLMVTDYSSVAFDFAYLRKPIVYSQFDKDKFFSGGHSYTEGYYDYQTDGFGEIVETLEQLVDKLIEYMDNDCELKEKYRERIENTFAYADKNCCARVLEKIRSRE